MFNDLSSTDSVGGRMIKATSWLNLLMTFYVDLSIVATLHGSVYRVSKFLLVFPLNKLFIRKSCAMLERAKWGFLHKLGLAQFFISISWLCFAWDLRLIMGYSILHQTFSHSLFSWRFDLNKKSNGCYILGEHFFFFSVVFMNKKK